MRYIRALAAPLIAAMALIVFAPGASADDDPAVGTQMWCGTGVEFADDGVRIRRQPNLTAAVNGLGYRGQDVTIHRWVDGPVVNGSDNWADLTNLATGVRGYVGGGFSFLRCR